MRYRHQQVQELERQWLERSVHFQQVVDSNKQN
jgi:hypothetical protein